MKIKLILTGWYRFIQHFLKRFIKQGFAGFTILLFLIYKLKKQDKNDRKTSKTLYQIGFGIYGQHFYIFIII